MRNNFNDKDIIELSDLDEHAVLLKGNHVVIQSVGVGLIVTYKLQKEEGLQNRDGHTLLRCGRNT